MKKIMVCLVLIMALALGACNDEKKTSSSVDPAFTRIKDFDSAEKNEEEANPQKSVADDVLKPFIEAGRKNGKGLGEL